ncbi:MAG: 50S ribosomal protein L21 [Patescibacteria group bacterium]
MVKIAVIRTGGKQYKVAEGQTLKVEKIKDAEEGGKVFFETLLTSSSDGKDLSVGKPSLGEKTEAEIVENGRSDKVNVVKFKNKIRYKRNIGHKQHYTKVKIASIK